jgi:N-acetylmuramoyl-L-alanine amidase
MALIKIALQAGHEGRTSGATGAPGEIELTVRIRNRLSQILISKGFQVYLFNADPPAAQLNQVFNLFLSLHGDANVYGTGGGFADYPEPSVDKATAESQRICRFINDSYFSETGIRYVNRSNKNTRYYYMWKMLSARTPCVLLEMGVVQDAHDKVLLANTELIANAIARAVSRAFDVPFDIPIPQPDYKAQIASLNKQITDLKNSLEAKNVELKNYKNKVRLSLTEWINSNT